MRKITYLICLLLLLSLLLTGCNSFTETQLNTPEETPVNTPAETPKETLPYEEDGDFVTTSDAMDYEIKCAILKEWPSANLTPDDIDIPYFYGEFNGVYALGFETGGIDALKAQHIGEYEFIYSGGGIKRDVYNSKDGEFYSLKEAYDIGLLTIEDVGVIHEQFVKQNERMYDFDENGEVISNQMPEIIFGSDGSVYVNGEKTGTNVFESVNLVVGEDGYVYLNGKKTGTNVFESANFVAGEDGYWYLNGENTGIKVETAVN